LRKVDLAGLAARKILRGGRHLVRHDGRDVQDMREEIVAYRYAAGAGDRVASCTARVTTSRVPSTSSIGP
jgi:hypothetical protein